MFQNDLIPIKRKSYDCVIDGKKSRGKTFFLAINAYLSYLEGKTIASNFNLNPDYFDYFLIESSEDLESLSNCICLCDDFERWFASKWTTTSKQKKSEMASVLLDLGKASVSMWVTCKRNLEIDKSLRATCDIFLSADIYLNHVPISYEEYLEKSKYLNYCQLQFEVYDLPEDKDRGIPPTELEIISDLEIYKDLFETTEKVKPQNSLL